jgi:hypothetical protein
MSARLFASETAQTTAALFGIENVRSHPDCRSALPAF